MTFQIAFLEKSIIMGEEKLYDYTRTVNLQTGMEQVFQERLGHLLRQYLLVGGMPGAVNAFAGNVSMEEIQRLLSGLIRTYTEDFAKYASTAKHKYLREVYASVPRMVGRRYKYSHINPNIESKFLQEALGLLCDARCITRMCHASGAGVPLAAGIKERKFKVAFLDVGMMQNALGIQASIILNKSVMQINGGSVAEQYAAQELLACADPYSDTPGKLGGAVQRLTTSLISMVCPYPLK